MSYTPNEIALLTFIKRVNETFSYFGEDGADYVSAEDMDYFKEICLEFRSCLLYTSDAADE